MSEGADPRSRGWQLGQRVVVPAVLALGVVGATMVVLRGGTPSEIVRDADLCPLQETAISSSSVLLVDLTKPLDADGTALRHDLLQEISMGLGRDAELRVFLLGTSMGSPRTPLGRLCKPYGDVELQVDTAKGRTTAGSRDCDDLPAQIPPATRSSANRFCALRATLQRRLDNFASQAAAGDVAGAYLVDAIEATKFDLRERPPPHTLYLFSDMMHHGSRYSHVELGLQGWDYEEFKQLPANSWRLDGARETGRLRVEVFYVPRYGWTDTPETGGRHRAFWRDYFADAEVTFHMQPRGGAYTVRLHTDASSS